MDRRGEVMHSDSFVYLDRPVKVRRLAIDCVFCAPVTCRQAVSCRDAATMISRVTSSWGS